MAIETSTKEWLPQGKGGTLDYGWAPRRYPDGRSDKKPSPGRTLDDVWPK